LTAAPQTTKNNSYLKLAITTTATTTAAKFQRQQINKY